MLNNVNFARYKPCVINVKKSIKIIFAICIIAIIGIIVLQVFWIRNYITVTRDRFRSEIISSFDLAAKKEFSQRGDSVEKAFYRYLLDTTQVIISNYEGSLSKYIIADAKNKKDRDIFSLPPSKYDTAITDPEKKREMVAEGYANHYRQGEFDKISLVFIRPDNINQYLNNLNEQYQFNATSLFILYKEYLKQAGIKASFDFFYGDTDTMLVAPNLEKNIAESYSYVTRPIPTYKFQKDFNYVIAGFKSPGTYLQTKLTWQIISSILLIITVAFAMYYLIRVIFREKRLSVIKNDFISNITHEFKTPIATSSAAIEAMEKFNVLDDPQKTKKYLAAAKNELVRLSDLVSKILDISIYEKRQVELKKENVHVPEMLEVMIYNFSLIKNNASQIHIHNECTDPVIRADKTHLYNSLSNIIDNALKYGGANVVIDITITCTRHEMQVEIKDNGPGMHVQHLPNIFDKFYRVPGSEHRIKGFGLGLFYTRSIIQEHGGWCRVESKPGKGTTFKIGLPT